MWLIIYSIVSTIIFYCIIKYTNNNKIGDDEVSENICAVLLFTVCLPHQVIIYLIHFILVCLKGHNYHVKIFGVIFTEGNPKYMSDIELVEYELKKFKINDIERYLRKQKLEKLN